MIDNLLHEELTNSFNELDKLEKGSQQYASTVDSTVKLMDRAIELEKLDAEQSKREYEKERDKERDKSEKKDRLVKNILTAAGIIIPSALTVWGTIKSLRFEIDGNVTSIMGRGFINKLLPKK